MKNITTKLFSIFFVTTILFGAFWVQAAVSCPQGYRYDEETNKCYGPGGHECPVVNGQVEPGCAIEASRNTGTADSSAGSFMGRAVRWGMSATIYPALMTIGTVLLGLTSMFVYFSGHLMDLAIQVSVIDMAKYTNDLEAIQVGWRLFKDVVNMFLIFILLYISIRTIIGVGNFNPNKLIKNVIIVALFINFSLFATRLVIDASNILAVGMYNNIKTSVVKGAKDEATRAKVENSAISTAFMSPIWASSFFYIPSEKTSQTGSGLDRVIGALDGMANQEERAVISTFTGSIFFLIITFVFLASMFMFITRFVTLIFLMVVSPVAFGSMAFPGLNKWWNQWLDKLFKNAFFAPIFLFLMYFVVYFMNNNNLKQIDDSFGVMLHIIIASGMMLGALSLSNKFSIVGSSAARNMAGSASMGLVGWAGRKTVGRTGSVVAESRMVRDLIASGNGVEKFVGRTLKNVGEKASKGSFDLRAAPGAGDVAKFAGGMGSISKSAKGGYAGWLKEQAKKIEEERKFVGGTSPEEKIIILEEQQREAGQANEVQNIKNEVGSAENLISEYDRLTEEFVNNNSDIKALKEAKEEIEKQKEERRESLLDLIERAKKQGSEDEVIQARQKLRDELTIFDRDIDAKNNEINQKIEEVSSSYKSAINYDVALDSLNEAKTDLDAANRDLTAIKEGITKVKDQGKERMKAYTGDFSIIDGKVDNENAKGLGKRTFSSTLFGTTRLRREQAVRFNSPEYEKEQKSKKEREELAKVLMDSVEKKDEKKEEKPAGDDKK